VCVGVGFLHQYTSPSLLLFLSFSLSRSFPVYPPPPLHTHTQEGGCACSTAALCFLRLVRLLFGFLAFLYYCFKVPLPLSSKL
jgi:hypothetical protein